MPCDGPGAEIARRYHVATEETWQGFKLFILRMSLYGTWGDNIRVGYGKVADVMGSGSTRKAQDLVTAARQLGWLVRVGNAGSRGGPDGGGTASLWRVNTPYAADDDVDATDDPWRQPVPARSSNFDQEPPF
ncbi:hypothetical protein SAMN04489832_6240 [Micromonospora cremea]|uniref:Uncharacterized protein n=1 Tax=Micromonospora cremea TaxID=709881 RepID=A0A1N6AVM6_9ACTN|nr:hypothetical protein SAMN04489832_6240 [Micromonospora cremea]